MIVKNRKKIHEFGGKVTVVVMSENFEAFIVSDFPHTHSFIHG